MWIASNLMCIKHCGSAKPRLGIDGRPWMSISPDTAMRPCGCQESVSARTIRSDFWPREFPARHRIWVIGPWLWSGHSGLMELPDSSFLKTKSVEKVTIRGTVRNFWTMPAASPRLRNRKIKRLRARPKTVPIFVPTTNPYRVRWSASFLCRCLCRNPAIPAHVGEDHSVSLRLCKVSSNAQGHHKHCRSAPLALTLCRRMSFGA